MAKITFYMSRQEGHLLPTFKLARALKARGHSVEYLCVADVGGFIEARGLDFVPVLEDVCPKGTSAHLAHLSLAEQGRHTELVTRRIFRAIADGALEPVLEERRPD